MLMGIRLRARTEEDRISMFKAPIVVVSLGWRVVPVLLARSVSWTT